ASSSRSMESARCAHARSVRACDGCRSTISSTAIYSSDWPDLGQIGAKFGLARRFLLHCPPVAGAQQRAGFLDGRAAFSQGRSGLYDVGDKVVYPHHAAGTVVKKEKREVLGQQREYLTIKILHNDMTVQVPSENAEKVGLRRVIGEKEVGVVLKALTGVSTEMPKNWNRRFKHNRDKMKTGDILELAEVVRNLALRDREKGLSTGEKQMFVKAKKILASELMYAKDMDEETCADWLEEVLASDSPPKKKPAAKKKAAAAATA